MLLIFNLWLGGISPLGFLPVVNIIDRTYTLLIYALSLFDTGEYVAGYYNKKVPCAMFLQ